MARDAHCASPLARRSRSRCFFPGVLISVSDDASPEPSAPLPGVTVEREPLPLDPAGLPALGEAFWSIVREGCRELAVELTPAQLAAVDAHARSRREQALSALGVKPAAVR